MGKQKLSPKGAADKKKRDLAAANTPDREKKRADSQKKRREAIKDGKDIKGKDFDHNTRRFVPMAFNRGGTQAKNRPDGTKQEKEQSRRA